MTLFGLLWQASRDTALPLPVGLDEKLPLLRSFHFYERLARLSWRGGEM